MNKPIEYIVHLLRSKRDRWGNVYEAAIITECATGNQVKFKGVPENNVVYAMRGENLETVCYNVSEELGQRKLMQRTEFWCGAPCNTNDLRAWVTGEFVRLRDYCECGHRWDYHVRQPNGAQGCKICGCRDVVLPVWKEVKDGSA